YLRADQTTANVAYAAATSSSNHTTLPAVVANKREVAVSVSTTSPADAYSTARLRPPSEYRASLFCRYITYTNQPTTARNSTETAWRANVAPVPPPGTRTTSAAIAITIPMLRTVVSIRFQISPRGRGWPARVRPQERQPHA